MNSDILDRLKKSPVFASALREVEEQELIPRRELVKQLQQANLGAGTEGIAVAVRADKLTAELHALKVKTREVQAQLHECIDRAFVLSSTNTNTRNRVLAQLHAGANPRIGNFVMWAERAQNLANFSSFFDRPVGFDDHSEVRVDAGIARNAVAAASLTKIVNRCVERAHQMRLEASPGIEVEAELGKMASEVYAAYQAISGARSFPADYEGSLL